MTERIPPHRSTGFERASIDRMLETSRYFDNTAQEFIQTTSDKLRLCLIEHRQALKSQTDWMAPLGIFLTLLATSVASDFKDFLGISKEVWESIHNLAMVVTLIWLVSTIYRAIKNRNTGDIDTIISAIKKGE